MTIQMKALEQYFPVVLFVSFKVDIFENLPKLPLGSPKSCKIKRQVASDGFEWVLTVSSG